MEYSKAKLKSNAGDKASPCFSQSVNKRIIRSATYVFRIQYEKLYIAITNNHRPKCCLPRFKHVGAPSHPKWSASYYNLNRRRNFHKT